MEKHIGCGFNKITIHIESIEIEEIKKNNSEETITEENNKIISKSKKIKKPRAKKKTVIDMIN